MDTERFRELLDQMQAGSDEAAWELVRLYGPHVQSIVRRRMNGKLRRSHDTEDFVQGAWASLIRAMPRFKDVRDPKKFVAALATIAYRRMANEVDYKQRKSPDSCGQDLPASRSEDKNIGPAATPSQIAVARESWQSLVGGLSTAHREIVDLRLRGMTFDEIALETGLHKRTARRVVERAIQLRHAKDSKGDSV